MPENSLGAPLALVDANDRQVGVAEKMECHEGEGILHRAFSVFIFDAQGRVLIQKRASDKRLWPSYWSNSCCSHPRRGETLEAAVRRRLSQELGLPPAEVQDLQYIYKFEYHARFGRAGSEHELCSVFRARFAGEPVVNVTEIEDWDWMTPAELTQRLGQPLSEFTPWLRLEWPRVVASA